MQTVSRAIEGAKTVKLGKGVVGKSGQIVLAVLAIWAVVATRWSDNLTADAGLALIGLVATVFAIWFITRSFAFAEKNPSQAMLEGAEFLEWHKLGLQVSGKPAETDPVLIEDAGSAVKSLPQGGIK